jgi:hypothetical protein
VGQVREDDGLRQEVGLRSPAPRAEDDPVFQARRQAADLAAQAARARAVWRALGWFCFWEWIGAAIAFSGLHAETARIGWVIVWFGYLVGNTGAFLAVWRVYVLPKQRGDW